MAAPTASAPHHPRNLLVTGGAGFIGCNYVALALTQGVDKVVNLDALTYAGNRDNLGAFAQDPRHVFVHGSILDEALLDRVLGEHGIDTIVHFAAESHVDRSIDGPDAFISTNVVGTLALLKAARRAWQGLQDVRFHHVSTD